MYCVESLFDTVKYWCSEYFCKHLACLDESLNGFLFFFHVACEVTLMASLKFLKRLSKSCMTAGWTHLLLGMVPWLLLSHLFLEVFKNVHQTFHSFIFPLLYPRYAKSWSDHRTGNSYCLFFPYPPKHLLNSPSKSKTIRSQESDRNDGFMYVSIIASLREEPQVQGAAHALFVGGFSIEDVGKVV